MKQFINLFNYLEVIIMNKTKEYVYEVSEQSTDIRYFEIVSDKKLTESEIHDAICLPNISKEGDCV